MSFGWTGLIIRRYPTINSRRNTVYLNAVETFEMHDYMTCGEYVTHTFKFDSAFRALLCYARLDRGQYGRYIKLKNQ